MIEKVAAHLASKIKAANPDETNSTEILTYGIAMSMNILLVIVGCFIIGIATGHLIGTFTSFAAFAVLRRFSGGYHAKSLGLCVVITVILFASIPLITIDQTASWIMKLCSLLLVVILAPANCKENGIHDRQKRLFKAVSIFLAIVHLFIDSPIITLAIFSQAILLISFKHVKEVIAK